MTVLERDRAPRARPRFCRDLSGAPHGQLRSTLVEVKWGLAGQGQRAGLVNGASSRISVECSHDVKWFESQMGGGHRSHPGCGASANTCTSVRAIGVLCPTSQRTQGVSHAAPSSTMRLSNSLSASRTAQSMVIVSLDRPPQLYLHARSEVSAAFGAASVRVPQAQSVSSAALCSATERRRLLRREASSSDICACICACIDFILANSPRRSEP